MNDNKINPFSERIKVSFDYYTGVPHLVYFEYDASSNHESYKCLSYIWRWLEDNNIDFIVHRFQSNECEIFVNSEEARTMLKLMFRPLERQYNDYYPP